MSTVLGWVVMVGWFGRVARDRIKSESGGMGVHGGWMLWKREV